MPLKNKTIVMIHGAGMEAGIWDALAERLPDFPCRALSLPGHGKTATQKTEGPLLPSIAEMAAWVETQIREYPAQSVILTGHSMGALVALEAARNHTVAALVLTGAAARMPVHADLLKQAVAAPDAAAAMILKWGVAATHPQEIQVKIVETLKQQMQPAALANDLSACNAYQDGEATAKTVRQPALVLSGSEDKLTKAAEGQALANMLPHARFHLVAGSGHMLMVENPFEIAKEIDVFIATLNS